MDGFNIFRKLAFGTGINYKLFDVRMNYTSDKEKKSNTDDLKSCLVPHQIQKAPSNPTTILDDTESDYQTFSTANVSNELQRPKRKKKKISKERLAQIKLEEVTHFRRIHQIQVWGSDIPHPVENFSQLLTNYDLHPSILANISKLGYSSPTPIQMQVIPIMLHGRQVLACAPTGSGKTAAFLIPIIQKLKTPKKKGPRVLIVAPTRELVNQLYNESVRLSDETGLRPSVLDKTLKLKKNKNGKLIRKKIDILISTPNRLIYMLQQDPSPITLEYVRWLIIDESDKLFETGKQGFRDQLAAIYKACDFASIKRAMFSATFSHDVEEWCKLNLDELITVSVGDRNTAVDTVKQELVFTGDNNGKLLHFRDLIRQGFKPPVLVFVDSKEQAKKLHSELMFDGINVDAIHADRSLLEREKAIRDFRLGKVWVLVCTDLIGRGIDFKGVNLVVNYDLPPDAISYIHRIGRTGRAGKSGQAITYFNEKDFPKLKRVFRGRLRQLLADFENAPDSIPLKSLL